MSDKQDDPKQNGQFGEWINSHGDIIGGLIAVMFILGFIINIFR